MTSFATYRDASIYAPEIPPTKRTKRTVSRVVSVVAVASLIAVVVYGCAKTPNAGLNGIPQGHEGVARIELRSDQMESDGEALAKAVRREVDKLRADRVIENAQGTREDTKVVRSAFDDMQACYQAALDTVKRRDREIHERDTKFKLLEGRWFVFVGRWIERLIIFALVAWVALGLFGAYFAGPVGILGWLGRHALNIIPFSNIFTAIANKKAA